jgi:hypothetical protein
MHYLMLVGFLLVILPREGLSQYLYAQISPLSTDTIVVRQQDSVITYIPRFPKRKTDTLLLSKKDPIVDFINKQADKNEFRRWLAGLVLDTVSRKDKQPESLEIDRNTANLEGKQIRTVHFTRLDPFGVNVNDTIGAPLTWFQRAGNNVRVSTSKTILKKNLTFKAGEEVDPGKILESERLLRQLDYISDARIVLRKNGVDTSMVDVIVITQDHFPHAFNLGLNASNPQVTLYSTNLLGQGFGLSQSFVVRSPELQYGYQSSVNVQSIRGSQVDVGLGYTNQPGKHELLLQAQRSFYRSDIRMAGGLTINRSYENNQILGAEQIQLEEALNYFITNVWLGRSFPVSTDNYFNKSQYYISVQNTRSEFYHLPDTLYLNPDLNYNDYYFGSFSFSKRNYYKNKLIHSFGRTEDVPYGFLATLTLGCNVHSKQKKPYLGGHFSFGKALVPNRGYLAAKIHLASFFNRGKSEQGELVLGTSYISSLVTVGNSPMRNFVGIQYLKGFNRLPYEYIYLDENKGGISAFGSSEVKGKEKLALKTESVFFLPSHVLGFQFAFFSFADVGFIGNGYKGLFEQDHYVSFGAGLRIRNDKLVFKTLQLRLAFLPVVPDGVFPVNVLVTGETGRSFQDFVPGAPFDPQFR